MDRILALISQNKTLDITQISEVLNKSPTDTKKIMDELEIEDLVQKYGNYYQLSYKGYKMMQLR